MLCNTLFKQLEKIIAFMGKMFYVNYLPEDLYIYFGQELFLK